MAEAAVAAALDDGKLQWYEETAAAVMREIQGEAVPLSEVWDRVGVSKDTGYKVVRLLKHYDLVDGGRGRSPDYTVTDAGRRWLDATERDADD